MTPPRFLVEVNGRGFLETENIGGGVILGRTGHEFNMGLF